MQKIIIAKLFVALTLVSLLIFSFSLRKIDRYTPLIKKDTLEIIKKLKDLSLLTVNIIQEDKLDSKISQSQETIENNFRILEDKYNEIIVELNKKNVSKELKEGLKYIRVAMVNYKMAIESIKSNNYQNSKNYLRFVNFYLNTAIENINKRG